MDTTASKMARAFDKAEARPEAAAEREDVLTVLKHQATPVNPNPVRYVEPRPEMPVTLH